MDNLNINNLNNIKTKINKLINTLNNIYVKRQSKITMNNIVFGSLYKCLNNYSYDDVKLMINNKNIEKGEYNKVFTTEAFIIKKNNIDSNHFLNLNNSLIDQIYDDNKERIFGVDGSNLDLFKNFNLDKYPYASSKTKNYCKAYISCLFDINTKIPVNYNLSIKNDERQSFKEQFKYLKKNDIVILDRGYYSDDLLISLEKINVKYIFRLPINLNIIKNLDNLNEYIFEKNNIKQRLVKYIINNQEYYLLTNLFNKTIDELKNNYWSRWEVEINFKKAKYNLSLNKLNCKCENSLKQELYFNQLSFILYYYINLKTNIELKTKNKCKINDKSGIKFFIENICYIFNKKLTNKQINIISHQFKNINNSSFYIQPNRHFERKSIIKKSGWYYSYSQDKKNKDKKNMDKKDIKKIKKKILLKKILEKKIN